MKKLFTILSLILVLIIISPSISLSVDKVFQVDTAGTLTTSLSSYYKLEDVNDYYSTNTLTNNNTVAFNAGKVSNAADSGSSNTNKWLNVLTNMGWDGGNGSIDAWVNVTTAPASNAWNGITELASDNTKTGLGIAYHNDGGTLNLRFFRERVGVATDYTSYNTTLTTGTWYHVVVTYDGTNIRGYLNGSLVAGPTAVSGNGSYAGTVDDFAIFSFGATGAFSQGFSGLVDELGVWTKTLSSTEITDLYNGGSGQTMVEAVAAQVAPLMKIIWWLE